MRIKTCKSSIAFLSLAILATYACSFVHAESQGNNLVASHPTHDVSFSLKQLEANLESESVRLFHPYYEKEKYFEAFPLGILIEGIFGDTTQKSTNWKVEFVALDGYRVTVDWSKLFEPGGYFVFRDIDIPDWEKMESRQVSPAPFSVVWLGKEQLAKNGYPWPWQIASMRLLKLTDSN